MYDVIIAGGGPAGLNAGLYCARSGLKTVLFERLFAGGQAAVTSEIDNYIGVGKTDGPSLCMKMLEQATEFGLEIKYEEITEFDLSGEEKTVKTSDKEYTSKSVILCMGAHPKKLGAVGEDKFFGRGVSYCATCDGNFYKGKTVCVIGGGDTAFEDALYLSGISEKVYIIHRRDTFRANKALQDSVMGKSNVELVLNSVCEEIRGDDFVKSIVIKNVISNDVSDIKTDGVFCAVGTYANTELVSGDLKLSDGYIITDENMRTSKKRVYAAGDIRVKPLRQIITAASDGAVAAKSAFEDISL